MARGGKRENSGRKKGRTVISTSITLKPEQLDKLKELAVSENTTVSRYIVKQLDLDTEEKSKEVN